MQVLTTIVKTHDVNLGVTLDWPQDPRSHQREYSCLTCGVPFIHKFNQETWKQALKRAGLNAEDHPQPVLASSSVS